MKPVQIVLVGEPATRVRGVAAGGLRGLAAEPGACCRSRPGEDCRQDHPAHGKGHVGGRAAAYVCEGPVCSLPLTEPQTLVDNARGVALDVR